MKDDRRDAGESGFINETEAFSISGYLALVTGIAAISAAGWLLYLRIVIGNACSDAGALAAIACNGHALTNPAFTVPVAGGGLVLFAFFIFSGLYSLEPKQTAVMFLFGSFAGVDRNVGLRFTIPFYRVEKISQRIRNEECGPLKVNDLQGNPISIGAVIVWRVASPAAALLQVENYQDFVKIQAESALRMIGGSYPYDGAEAAASDGATRIEGRPTTSLRESGEEVAEALRKQISERCRAAGVEVIEARISHLAYAPEIAAAMLRRQQAAAVVAARKLIVDGAVDMVHDAIERISKKGDIQLDDERRAALISNLLVVLVGDKDPSPIVNTGAVKS